MPDRATEEFRAVVREFLVAESSESRVRELMGTEPGFDPVVWKRAARELGLLGLAVPEAYGGAGAGPVELGVVFEEMGRVLFCGPYLATVGLAVTALLQAADESTSQRLLGPIVAGDSIAALAWSGPEPHLSSLVLEGGAITGCAGYVLDGAVADLILVAARDAAGEVALLSVPPGSPGLTRTRLTTMDSTRGLARLDFDQVTGTLLASDAAAALERTIHIARLLLAAEALGGAQRAFESALEYSLDRVQFGRPIGSFQVIKHRCADLLMEVELARSVVYHGLRAAAGDPTVLPAEAALAASFCSDAYLSVAAANIQIHGGTGFTWEHSAHLYLKRAKSTSLLFGTATAQRRQLAQSLGLTP